MMSPNRNTKEYVMLWVVACCGKGSGVLRHAKQMGVSGGTILYGKSFGTSQLLDFFGLDEYREEIVLMATDIEKTKKIIDILKEEYDLGEEDGIYAFTIPICGLLGSHSMMDCDLNMERGETAMNYQLITVIVDKGKGEDAIDAAIRAGSKGGTIINARGSGIHETSKVFAMEIEPEKEIAIILSPENETMQILSAIREDLRIDEPGNGIVYIHDVNGVYGSV